MTSPRPLAASNFESHSNYEYVLFFEKTHPFSNFYPANFTLDGTKFNCTEQYFHYEKAAKFGDFTTAIKILLSKDPMEQKFLGRRVEKFDEDTWNSVCFDVMKAGNLAKFTQNAPLQEILLQSIGKTPVECSPWDLKWGIGYSTNDPRALNRNEWRGKNLMGECLLRVREQIVSDMLEKEGYIR